MYTHMLTIAMFIIYSGFCGHCKPRNYLLGVCVCVCVEGDGGFQDCLLKVHSVTIG